MAPPARIPPTPGLVGFDFGVKPAVFLATLPRLRPLMNQQDDEDIFPILNCWETFGNTMDVAVSGIGLCGCFSDASVGPGTRFWSPSNLVGVNGIWTLAASSPGDPTNTIWSAVIGTVELQEYDGSPTRPAAVCDGTTIGAPVTVEVRMQVDCFFAQNKWLTAGIGISGGPIGDTAAAVFASTSFPPTYFQAGDTVPNIISCTLDGIDYYNQAAAGGAVTVFPP